LAARKTKTAPKKSGTKRRRGVKLEPTQLRASELAVVPETGALDELAARVESGRRRGSGALSRAARGHPRLFAALPLECVEPTPFQRDVNDAQRGGGGGGVGRVGSGA
jgi:ParB family chromosome partitioning protein